MMGPKPEGSCQGLECLNPATETDGRGRRLCKACAKYEAEDHHRLNFCPPWLVRTSFGSYPFRCSLTERAMYLLRAVTEDDPKRTPYVVEEFVGWRAALAKELGLIVPADPIGATPGGEPDDTPPWLRFQCHEEETGKTYYVPSKPAEKALCEAVHGSVSWKTLAKWLAWRSRVAEALGLVEPSKNRTGVCPSAAIDVAVAAELRRMADWVGDDDARRVVSARLRARADELDPDYGPCRSCSRTGEGIMCDQCEDEERDA